MNHQEQQLLNITYTATREHRAEIDELKARVETLEALLKEGDNHDSKN